MPLPAGGASAALASHSHVWERFFFFFYGCPRSESESPLLSTAYPLYHSCSFYYWNAFFGLFVNDCFFMDFAALLRIVFTLRCLHSYWETWMLMLNISIPDSDCFLSFAPSAVVFCFVCFLQHTPRTVVVVVFFKTRPLWLPDLAPVICQHRIVKLACPPRF